MQLPPWHRDLVASLPLLSLFDLTLLSLSFLFRGLSRLPAFVIVPFFVIHKVYNSYTKNVDYSLLSCLELTNFYLINLQTRFSSRNIWVSLTARCELSISELLTNSGVNTMQLLSAISSQTVDPSIVHRFPYPFSPLSFSFLTLKWRSRSVGSSVWWSVGSDARRAGLAPEHWR